MGNLPRAARIHAPAGPSSGTETGRAGSTPPLAWVQRRVIAGLLVANGALFWRGPIDIFSLPRATLVVVATVALVGLSAIRVLLSGALAIPRSPIIALATVFVMMLGLVAIGGPSTMHSVIGPYTRYTGLAMYATYAALFVFVVRLHDRSSVRELVWGSVAGLALVTGYGLIQLVGVDPLSWPQSAQIVRQFGRFNTDFSTLGNVDFSAAYAGITAPFALWGALSSGHRRAARIPCAVLVVATTIYAVGTGAFQGPVTVAVGCSVVVAVWVAERRHSWQQLALGARRMIGGSAAVFAVAVLVATPLVLSHTAGQLRQGEERVQFWKTAVAIWLDDPVSGGGIGVFAREFTARRPTEHATQRQFQSADAPHNVALELLADGGLLVALPYLGIVGCTASLLFRALRTTRGETRLLLAAFGGSWVAYQVQSMVSIDVPPLALLHWTAIGGIVVLSGPPPLRAYRVQVLRRRPSAPDRDVGPSPVRRSALALGAVAMTGIAATWRVSQPLRADVAAAHARDARSTGDLDEARARAEQATDLAGWEGSYWALRAGVLDQAGDLAAASAAGERAAKESPWNSTYALAVAGLAERRHESGEAIRWLAEAVRRDPDNPAVLQVAARFHLKQGSAVSARRMLEHAVVIDPRRADSWRLLGEARQRLGDDEGAAAAFARAARLSGEKA